VANKAYILFIGLAFIVIGFGIVAFIKHEQIKAWLEKEETKAKIRELCRMAEQLIVGTKMGKERLAWCVEQLRKYVPPDIAKYITTEMLIKAINIIFEQIAVVMRDGSRKAV